MRYFDTLKLILTSYAYRTRHGLGKSFNNGFPDVFASKPAVKKDYSMLVFVPFLKVIFVYSTAFLY